MQETEGTLDQRDIFNMVRLKNSAQKVILQNLLQTKKAQQRSSRATVPPSASNTPGVTTNNSDSGFSLRDINTHNKSAQLLLCEAPANSFSSLAGESVATLNMNKLVLMKQLGNGLVSCWF